MTTIYRNFYLLVLLIGTVCLSVGYVGVRYSLNWALTKDASSIGLDWARHVENRIPDLTGMKRADGALEVTNLPRPDDFAGLVSDIVSIGHIYQFDFINTNCFCELSLGSFRKAGEDLASNAGNHDGHDHSLDDGHGHGITPDAADIEEAIQPNKVKVPSSGAVKHLFQSQGVHPGQKLNGHNPFQHPVEREIVQAVLDDRSSNIIIRRDYLEHQPTMYAEVYHIVKVEGEIAYILRALVNLEEQAKLYTQFIYIGVLVSFLVLGLTFGYPAHRYLLTLKRQKEADRRAHFLAHHDVLTNLHNRNDFHESVSDILWNCHEKKQSALLFLFDLNNFKEVNDYYGHHIGDKLLCEFATLLKKHTPKGGYIARLGGDEFVVVLGGIHGADICHEDYLSLPNALRMTINDGAQTVEATIAGGVVQYPRDAETTAELVQVADLALYAAKPNRLGEIREFDPQMKKDFYERLDLREEFRQALNLSQIEPYYQPIMNMNTGKVEGFEALARWNHPERGLLTPFVFGDVFQDGEICALLGAQMFNKIVADMKDWVSGDVAFKTVCLNVVDADLKRETFARDIIDGLHEKGLSPNDLTIEVTENCFFDDNKAAFTRQLESLRSAGCYIALDDFGTGYSSITQLKDLPITAVKIDKSFIDDVLNDKDDQSIIFALLGLGKSMDFKLILEGIETGAQRRFLKEMGFELAQGYFFSRPMSAAEVPAFTERQNSNFVPGTMISKSA